MSGDIMIRHTASAGVLITIGGSCVGADVFSRDPAGLYPDTPADVRADYFYGDGDWTASKSSSRLRKAQICFPGGEGERNAAPSGGNLRDL